VKAHHILPRALVTVLIAACTTPVHSDSDGIAQAMARMASALTERTSVQNRSLALDLTLFPPLERLFRTRDGVWLVCQKKGTAGSIAAWRSGASLPLDFRLAETFEEAPDASCKTWALGDTEYLLPSTLFDDLASPLVFYSPPPHGEWCVRTARSVPKRVLQEVVNFQSVETGERALRVSTRTGLRTISWSSCGRELSEGTNTILDWGPRPAGTAWHIAVAQVPATCDGSETIASLCLPNAQGSSPALDWSCAVPSAELDQRKPMAQHVMKGCIADDGTRVFVWDEARFAVAPQTTVVLRRLWAAQRSGPRLIDFLLWSEGAEHSYGWVRLTDGISRQYADVTSLISECEDADQAQVCILPDGANVLYSLPRGLWLVALGL
jgi:hypothetical protein